MIESAVDAISLLLFVYLAIFPLFCWGWLSRARVYKPMWWLSGALYTGCLVLHGFESSGSMILAGAGIVAFAAGRHRAGRGPFPARALPLIFVACLLELLAWNTRIDGDRVFSWSDQVLQLAALWSAVCVVAMSIGFGLGKLIGRRRLPRLPYALAVIFPFLLNPFHPVLLLAYICGGVTGWLLGEPTDIGQSPGWRAWLRAAAWTFVFWVLAAGMWDTLANRSFPFGIAYSELFVINLSLSLAYARYLKVISTADLTLSSHELPLRDEVDLRSAGEFSRWANRIKVVIIAALLAFWIVAVLDLGQSFPLWFAGVLGLWLIGFAIGKSTKVPIDPTQAPMCPRVKLSYYDYDRWAHGLVLASLRESYFESAQVPVTNKLSLLFESFSASFHVWALNWALVSLGCLDLLLGIIVFSSDAQVRLAEAPPGASGSVGQIMFGVAAAWVVGQMCGLACGSAYRWLRANW